MYFYVEYLLYFIQGRNDSLRVKNELRNRQLILGKSSLVPSFDAFKTGASESIVTAYSYLLLSLLLGIG